MTVRYLRSLDSTNKENKKRDSRAVASVLNGKQHTQASQPLRKPIKKSRELDKQAAHGGFAARTPSAKKNGLLSRRKNLKASSEVAAYSKLKPTKKGKKLLTKREQQARTNRILSRRDD